MALEDFFTLSEMKNGLTTLTRVEELISIMHQKDDCATSNFSATARQWTSVASTLAATDNKDCLNQFVQLNGLFYLNLWIQEALKYTRDNENLAVEEFLNLLLRSLKKLPISTEDSIASGLQLNIKQLIGFKSFDIAKKARDLSERWKHAIQQNGVSDKDENCEDGNNKSNSDVSTIDDVSSTHPVSNHPNISECKQASQLDNKTTNQIIPETSLNSAIANAIVEDTYILPSQDPNPHQNLSGANDFSLCSNAPRDVIDHGNASFFKDDHLEDAKMEVDIDGNLRVPSFWRRNVKIPSSSRLSLFSNMHKHKRSISCNLDPKDTKSCTLESLPRSASIDYVVPKYLKNMSIKPDMQDFQCNGSKLKRKDDLETSLNGKEDAGSASEVSKLYDIEKKSNVEMSQRSDLALEHGEIDVLEVAKQVAIGVERGVVDCREPFCISSPAGVGPMTSNRENSCGKNLNNEQDVDIISKPQAMEKCIFDLNDDICVEEEESNCRINSSSQNKNSINVSSPIATAAQSQSSPNLSSSSRPRFEGELNWKGSSATSAFRAPSPRKNLDSGQINSGKKRKASLFDIDLNVVSPVEDDLFLSKPMDKEDSIVVNSRKVERLNLDLNCIVDEDALHQNGDRTMSSVSSSSSKQKLPGITRGFDLNDNPNSFDTVGSRNNHQDSAIKIMGSKIADRDEYVNEAPQSYIMARPMMMPYGHITHPSYGYNGYNGHLIGHSVNFPTPFYGHDSIPYVVDSRGGTITPQILNTTRVNTSSSASIAHFLMSNVSNAMQPMHLNPSAFMPLDGRSREPRNLMSFWAHGHNGLTEDQQVHYFNKF